ncbi:uncharacterized protein LOC125068652 [Vanessa atalanta]|uniref:uncharacterized protein LOC125068652 n=1 Tax=Vanessa atalanta TaxID=42275 RepID=UPI001FCD9B61|nr:uncharacterized protein LOC125068652 [Vanessa atalanta]
MKCEIPEFARCCFCFPLRLGLLVWTYVKLIFILLLLVDLIFLVVTHLTHFYYDFGVNFIVISSILFSIFLCVDFAFHIILIVSAHTKEYRKMKWFYKEAMVALCLYIFGLFCFTVYVVYDFNFSLKYITFIVYILLFIWSIFFWVTISQAYLIMLVRSEALKLERSTNFEFTNRAVDAEDAIYNNDIVA